MRVACIPFCCLEIHLVVGPCLNLCSFCFHCYLLIDCHSSQNALLLHLPLPDKPLLHLRHHWRHHHFLSPLIGSAATQRKMSSYLYAYVLCMTWLIAPKDHGIQSPPHKKAWVKDQALYGDSVGPSDGGAVYTIDSLWLMVRMLQCWSQKLITCWDTRMWYFADTYRLCSSQISPHSCYSLIQHFRGMSLFRSPNVLLKINHLVQGTWDVRVLKHLQRNKQILSQCAAPILLTIGDVFHEAIEVPWR